MRACSRRLKWGQRAKALRTLLSPGVANEHPRAEAIIRDMHPSPRRQITPPADLGPGLQATTGHVAKALDALLSTDHTAMDFSGWSANLLLPVRGRPDIMHPIIDLLRAITNCEMPLVVYWLITVGSLVAIHKLDEDAQAARAELFLDLSFAPSRGVLYYGNAQRRWPSTTRSTRLPLRLCSLLYHVWMFRSLDLIFPPLILILT